MKLRAVVFVVLMSVAPLLVGGLANPVLADSLPPALTSEKLVSIPNDVHFNFPEFSCYAYNPRPATIEFRAIGQATGPYAGTFNATGQATVDRTPSPGSVVMFHLDFSIASVSGNITGTEDLLTPTDGFADCYHDLRFAALAPVSFTYAAAINTAQGTYAARGTGSGNLFMGLGNPPPNVFDQIFTSGISVFDPVNISPPSLGFGSLWVGTTSAVRLVTLRNVGSGQIAVKRVDIVGPDSGDYTESDTCTDVLGPTNSCTISVQFTPSHTGPHSAAIAIRIRATGRPSIDHSGSGLRLIPMIGIGFGIATSLSPAELLEFADTPLGTASNEGSVVVTSIGGFPIQVSSVTLAGSSPSSFQVTSDLCSGRRIILSCSISVRFVPAAAGLFEATLVIVSDAISSPDSIVLLGSGI